MVHNMRQWLLSLVFALFALPALAAGEDVKAFADKLAGNALVIVKNEKLSEAEKQSQLEALFKINVDIPWVAKFVMGKHWKAATEQQRSDYLSNYEKFILKNYTSKLTSYSGQEYKILDAKKDADGDYLLTMEVVSSNGDPNVLMDYRIRKVGTGFKIFDIIVEGVSMITTQRSEFGSVITNQGIEYLIEALKKKTAS